MATGVWARKTVSSIDDQEAEEKGILESAYLPPCSPFISSSLSLRPWESATHFQSQSLHPAHGKVLPVYRVGLLAQFIIFGNLSRHIQK